MKNKIDEIYESKIVHTSFLDKESIVDAMMDSYILGLNESEEKYNKLKLNEGSVNQPLVSEESMKTIHNQDNIT